MSASDVVAELLAVLPADRVLTDPGITEAYRHDEAEWAPHGRPTAVVRARSTAEVSAAVRAAAAHRVPVVPRGAGTGLSGGANAVDGCVLLSLEAMREIVRIDPGERLAVVQPGVVNDDLRAAAAARGLWYPPDPASSPWSTVGGNVATNAGGLCCVKYGVTRDYVLALEVVLVTGEVVRLGHNTAKGVSGYDLVGLVVGSEGTLGVVTEVTVRLRPARTAPTRTVVGFFDTLAAVGDAVAGVTAAGLQPAAFELIDRHCLRAVEEWKRMALPTDAAALLLAQTDLPDPAGRPRRTPSSPSSSRPGPATPWPPPTRPRPRRCSTPAGWPTRPWSSSATPCSPRTSACPAPSWPPCWPGSRPSAPSTGC